LAPSFSILKILRFLLASFHHDDVKPDTQPCILDLQPVGVESSRQGTYHGTRAGVHVGDSDDGILGGARSAWPR
jgi:hypothetical protein